MNNTKITKNHESFYISKNNRTKCKLIDIENDITDEMTDDKKINLVALRILKLY